MTPHEHHLREAIAVLRVHAARACAGGSIGPNDENDLVQELVERLLSKDAHILKRFDPSRGSSRAYFGNYARLRIIDIVRKYAGRQKLFAGFKDQRPLSEPNTPADWFIMRDIDSRVRECLDRLSERDQEIFYLSVVEGLTAREVGTLLEVSGRYVSRRKNWILEKLEAYLRRE